MTQEELDSKLLEICKSKEDRSKELKMLIILGASIFCYTIPVSSCCKVKNLNHIKILVKSGVDIDLVLFYSARDGYLEGVKYAIENGANIHVYNDHSLRMAANNGHLDIVKFLVENGANIHACSDELLRLATQSVHSNVSDYLKEVLKQEIKI